MRSLVQRYQHQKSVVQSDHSVENSIGLMRHIGMCDTTENAMPPRHKEHHWITFQRWTISSATRMRERASLISRNSTKRDCEGPSFPRSWIDAEPKELFLEGNIYKGLSKSRHGDAIFLRFVLQKEQDSSPFFLDVK